MDEQTYMWPRRSYVCGTEVTFYSWPRDIKGRAGWVCPKCGCVYAPHVSECRHCNRPGLSNDQWPSEYIPYQIPDGCSG